MPIGKRSFRSSCWPVGLICLITVAGRASSHHSVAAFYDDRNVRVLDYSVGHWDGDTLVVETTNIDRPYFDDVGTPMSSALQTVERYPLSADGQRVNMEMTVTDPVTFTEPGHLTGTYWVLVPGEQIKPYECAL